MISSNDRYDSLFQYFADAYDLDWRDLKAQVKAESNFNPTARSGAGALGLAQFMPKTFTEWADRLGIPQSNPYNPEHSIWCQAAYMAHLRERYHGDQYLALAAYNFGLGNVDKTAPKDFPEETKNYLKRIGTYRAVMV